MNRRWAMWLSFPLAVLVVIASSAGLFWTATYSRETGYWATEGQGGDAVTLFLIVPIFLISTTLALRGSVAASLVWMGGLTYILYNYTIYAVAVHFNNLFLVYCAALGFSFYALLGGLRLRSPSEIAKIYSQSAPLKTAACVLLLIALLFTFLWLREIIPALASNQPPKSVTDAGLLTSPVHVLDLSIVLPGCVVTAIMLLRRKSEAFILAPVLISFAVFMIAAVAGMFVAAGMHLVAAALAIAAAGLVLLLVRYLRVSAVSVPQARSTPRQSN